VVIHGNIVAIQFRHKNRSYTVIGAGDLPDQIIVLKNVDEGDSSDIKAIHSGIVRLFENSHSVGTQIVGNSISTVEAPAFPERLLQDDTLPESKLRRLRPLLLVDLKQSRHQSLGQLVKVTDEQLIRSRGTRSDIRVAQLTLNMNKDRFKADRARPVSGCSGWFETFATRSESNLVQAAPGRR
jgi:hypothetical protein